MAAGFNDIMAGADYPVMVITTRDPVSGELGGCLAGFVTQCTINPPRLLICLSIKNHTYRVARKAAVLAAHLLDPDQHDVAARFGATTQDETEKFDSGWRPGLGGVPLINACPRWLAGPVLRQVPFGDHVGFVVEPTEFGVGSDAPMLMFSAVRDLEAGHEA